MEKRDEERWVGRSRKRAEARFTELKAHLKADIHRLTDRMERNHADPRHAIGRLACAGFNSERGNPS